MKTLKAFGKSLENLDARERAKRKGEEIHRLLKGKTTRHIGVDFDIEVVDSNPIPGGVEVFARAWNKDGTQIGFGDGTVDLERFRFINPPIMVPDGTKTSKILEDGNIVRLDNFIEDSEKALLLSLEHTISVVKRSGSDSIIKGKIGNTTTTIYPDPDVEDDSFDGTAQRVSTNAGWADVHDGAGTNSDDAGTLDYAARCMVGTTNFSRIVRGLFIFPTGVIGAGQAVSAAALSIFGSGLQDTPGWAPALRLVATTPGSVTAVANSDYAQFGTVSLATDIPYASLSAIAYNDFTLNASGLANISVTAASKFGTRWDFDATNTAPAETANTSAHFLVIMADTAGTTSDPKLVVTHASSGPSASRRSIITV